MSVPNLSVPHLSNLNDGDEFQILPPYALARKKGAAEKQAESRKSALRPDMP